MRKHRKVITLVTVGISLLIAYLVHRYALVVQGIDGNIFEQLRLAPEMFLPALAETPFLIRKHTDVSLKAALCAFVLVWLIYLYYVFGAKKLRRGEEHGSAEWNNAKEAAKFQDCKNADNNVILSNSEFLQFVGQNDFEYDRNKNVIVVGGSGCGKTFSFVKPNLMQLHSSYVVTDPKGTLLPQVGEMFRENHYVIKSLNTVNFKKSLHYNPLSYIRSQKDILKVVNVLIENTKGSGEKAGEDFWVKAERLLYSALIAYLYYECDPSECNIPMMIVLLEHAEVRENDEEYKSAVDVLFDELAETPGKEDCFAVKQYRKFKQAAGETAKSILISCGARLAPFDIDEIKELTAYDELEMDKIGDRKTAFFIIMSDTETTFSFLIAMCMYQMFNLLCEHADVDCGGELPVPVRCLFDEFANIGVIPNFHVLISTIRSRLISATLILQSLSQLKPIYKDNADTILDNCDSMVFLGGKSTNTTEQIAKMIGKETIDNTNINESRGQSGSYSINNQNLGRDLIDPAEIGRIKRTECIVMLVGAAPWRSKKYKTSRHHRFRQLADYDQKKLFDMAAYRENEWEVTDEVFESDKVEYDLSELNVLV